jgi:hypothetical protein
LFKLAVPQALALVIGSLVLVNKGIVAVSWLQAGIAIAAQIVTLAIVRRMLDVRIGDVLEALRPAVLAAAALSMALFAIELTIRAPWPAIGAGAAAGSVIYIGLLALLTPDTLRHLRTMIRAAPPPSGLELEPIPGLPLEEPRPNAI